MYEMCILSLKLRSNPRQDQRGEKGHVANFPSIGAVALIRGAAAEGGFGVVVCATTVGSSCKYTCG